MRAVRLAVSVALFACLQGCGFSGLNFVKDERVEITSPQDRAEVTLPVTVAWEADDFEVTGPDGGSRDDAGYYGVYVDRAPQAPHETQGSLVENDPACRSDPTCQEDPDADFLAQRNIHSTTEQSFTIDRLPQPSTTAQRRREFHEVTIVLLNGKGERIGESAFVREFEVDRGL